MPRKEWKCITVISFIFLSSMNNYAQDNVRDSTLVPFMTLFYRMDKHIVGSFTYNYGLNYVLAGAGTYGIVKSGLDWKWYRNAIEHKWISNAGFVSVAVGPLASVAVPLGLFLYGRSHENTDLQITGLAVGQAVLAATVITSGFKAITGRVPPENKTNINDYSGDFRFGFLRDGIYQGWPSSHTAAAFAMATTLIELYPDNATMKIGGLTYASLIGLGVSTNIHWFSDAVAGALIGYAIGESVGAGFRNLTNHSQEEQAYGISITPTGVMFTYRF